MSTKEDDNGNESKEPEFDEDKDQLEEKQEDEIEGLKEETTNQVFIVLYLDPKIAVSKRVDKSHNL
jgi:hypothetical protein